MMCGPSRKKEASAAYFPAGAFPRCGTSCCCHDHSSFQKASKERRLFEKRRHPETFIAFAGGPPINE
ncbi:hypothetical protein C3920_11015 [Novacetimonas pomaceti]|uniref:Uncharacterized protein n=1 Tax=Novacetimonas pomaceti TaxID=2021998 RepID=A0ABX5P0F4_9PROT|nr:hypothetical protein C3920_11015 [Novacetimonas pomaceti]